jgi:hypothetical protein
MEAFINLGKEYDSKGNIPTESPASAKKVDYPTLYISHGANKADLDDIADEGEAVIKYKLKRYSEDVENDSCSCELSVTDIKPLNKKQKKRKSSEDSLDETLDAIMSKKKGK